MRGKRVDWHWSVENLRSRHVRGLILSWVDQIYILSRSLILIRIADWIAAFPIHEIWRFLLIWHPLLLSNALSQVLNVPRWSVLLLLVIVSWWSAVPERGFLHFLICLLSVFGRFYLSHLKDLMNSILADVLNDQIIALHPQLAFFKWRLRLRHSRKSLCWLLQLRIYFDRSIHRWGAVWSCSWVIWGTDWLSLLSRTDLNDRSRVSIFFSLKLLARFRWHSFSGCCWSWSLLRNLLFALVDSHTWLELVI